MKHRIRIPIDKTSLGRLPIGRRPPQTIAPKKGKGSYRRSSRKRIIGES